MGTRVTFDYGDFGEGSWSLHIETSGRTHEMQLHLFGEEFVPTYREVPLFSREPQPPMLFARIPVDVMDKICAAWLENRKIAPTNDGSAKPAAQKPTEEP